MVLLLTALINNTMPVLLFDPNFYQDTFHLCHSEFYEGSNLAVPVDKVSVNAGFEYYF